MAHKSKSLPRLLYRSGSEHVMVVVVVVVVGGTIYCRLEATFLPIVPSCDCSRLFDKATAKWINNESCEHFWYHGHCNLIQTITESKGMYKLMSTLVLWNYHTTMPGVRQVIQASFLARMCQEIGTLSQLMNILTTCPCRTHPLVRLRDYLRNATKEVHCPTSRPVLLLWSLWLQWKLQVK